MELTVNNVLLFNAILIGLMLGFQLFRLRAFVDPTWLPVLAGTLAASAAFWIWLEPISGYAAIALELLLVVIPLRITVAATRQFSRMEYRAALKKLEWANLVHPSQSIRQLMRSCRAAIAAAEGDFTEAEGIAAEWQAPMRGSDELSGLFMCRLLGDWEGIVRQTESAASEQVAGNAALQRPALRMRGLAETGRLAEALGLYRRIRQEAPPAIAGALRQGGVEAIVLAFAGRPESAARAAELMRSGTIKEFWTATGMLVAGDERGRDRLEALLAGGPDAVMTRAIQHRLAHDWSAGAPAINAEDRDFVAQLETELDHHYRYSGQTPQAVRPRATFALAVLIGAVFVVEVFSGGSENLSTLWRMGAFSPQAAPVEQLWRAPASMFLHMGPLHLALNLFALIYFGAFVERSLGTKRFLKVYLISGLLSMPVLDLIHAGSVNDPEIVVGASGAIMGILGANAAIMLHGWLRGGAALARSRFFALAWIFGLQVAFDFFTPQVAGSVHIAGLLLGFFVALVMVNSAGDESSGDRDGRSDRATAAAPPNQSSPADAAKAPLQSRLRELRFRAPTPLLFRQSPGQKRIPQRLEALTA